jgi:hypothetical protein
MQTSPDWQAGPARQIDLNRQVHTERETGPNKMTGPCIGSESDSRPETGADKEIGL